MMSNINSPEFTEIILCAQVPTEIVNKIYIIMDMLDSVTTLFSTENRLMRISAVDPEVQEWAVTWLLYTRRKFYSRQFDLCIVPVNNNYIVSICKNITNSLETTVISCNLTDFCEKDMEPSTILKPSMFEFAM